MPVSARFSPQMITITSIALSSLLWLVALLGPAS